MSYTISKSEKKRRAKNVEQLSIELTELAATDIAKLPCDDLLKQDIKDAKGMKAGAKKRQIKFITKQLRMIDSEPLLDFLAQQKGSKLKQDKSFHELERMRDDIISEAIQAQREQEQGGNSFDSDWSGETLEHTLSLFPEIDSSALKTAATKYAKSRKPNFSREIFRILRAAMEQQQFQDQNS